jgi:hypothetical protein
MAPNDFVVLRLASPLPPQFQPIRLGLAKPEGKGFVQGYGLTAFSTPTQGIRFD